MFEAAFGTKMIIESQADLRLLSTRLTRTALAK
jgi:hypothetical protein